MIPKRVGHSVTLLLTYPSRHIFFACALDVPLLSLICGAGKVLGVANAHALTTSNTDRVLRSGKTLDCTQLSSTAPITTVEPAVDATRQLHSRCDFRLRESSNSGSPAPSSRVAISLCSQISHPNAKLRRTFDVSNSPQFDVSISQNSQEPRDSFRSTQRCSAANVSTCTTATLLCSPRAPSHP